MIPARIYVDLIGKPFERGARGPEKYDCVGLALEMARRLGKHPPNYLSDEEELHRHLAADGSALADCKCIDAAEPGCVVLLRMNENLRHLAFMVDSSRMLHTTARTGCVIERVTDPLWKPRVLGFYSLEGIR